MPVDLNFLHLLIQLRTAFYHMVLELYMETFACVKYSVQLLYTINYLSLPVILLKGEEEVMMIFNKGTTVLDRTENSYYYDL